MEHTQRSRGRPPNLTCHRCHMRKVKCDFVSKQPCTKCHGAGLACNPHIKKRRNKGPPRSSNVSALQPIVATAASLPSPSCSPAQQHISWGVGSTGPHNPRMPEYAAQHRSEAVAYTDGVQEGSPVSADPEVGQAAEVLSSMQEAPLTSDVSSHLVTMLSRDDMDHRVMRKGVRVVFIGQECSNMNYLIRHRTRNTAVHHFAADHLSRQHITKELDRISREAFALPPRAVVDDLLWHYFHHVNQGFPILDEKIFMNQYRNRDPRNPPSLLVLHAVLLVGAHVATNRPDRDELKATFFRRAKILFEARFEWNRDAVVQAALLLTWYSEGSDDIGANSYHWVGLAARTAQGLGMHRDVRPSTLVEHDKKLWQRLWWLIVQFDVLVSLSYGRPQLISLEDSDVPALRDSDFDSMGENVDKDFVMAHTNLCCIISKSLRDQFGAKSSARAKRASLTSVDQQLANWATSLPQGLMRKSDSNDSSFWSNVLFMNYNYFLVLLHRPQPTSAPLEKVIRQDDMGICTASAASILELLQVVLSKDQQRYLTVFSVDVVFSTLIQLSAEMRIHNPILASDARRKFDMALQALRSLTEYWLNAEIILRLFEDTSEKIRQELGIGNQPLDEVEPDELDMAPDIAMSSSTVGDVNHLDEYSGLFSTAPTSLEDNGLLADQLAWMNIYWDNPGPDPFSSVDTEFSLT